MGSSSSSAVSHTRSVGVSTRRNLPLSESEAWDIALAWRDQLRGSVRLETTTERLPHSIIPTFEWITFVFNGSRDLNEGLRHVKNPEKTAAYARAATIAWFALSCCEGYSGVENPQFWRRVFYELLYPKGLPKERQRSPRSPQRPITDAVRFFDDEDKPFPRIQLVVGEADATMKTECVFLGKIPYKNTAGDAKLQRILAKLQPFIRSTHWMRRVPVQVRTLDAPVERVAALLRDATTATTDHEVEPEPSPSSTVISMAFAQMQLQSVMVYYPAFSFFESLYSQLPRCDVDVIVDGRVKNIVQGRRLCRGLFREADMPDVEALRSRWHVLQLVISQIEELSYSHLSVVCSALPHLQSIKSVTQTTGRSAHGSPHSIAIDWAWLGYAIFHPDAALQSGFTSLELDLGGITSADITALTKMAVGNNLLGGVNTGYHEGRVRSSAKLWKSRAHDGVGRLHKFTKPAWVSLCVETADKVEDQDWVCVVVPGFGPGWIHSGDIIETRRRPPGKSCLRTLCVNFWGNNVSEDTLIGLLTVLGKQLTSLHLRHSPLITPSTVYAILRLCPALKSLRLRHDGSFWADEELAMELPRLQELELTLESEQGPPVPLQSLKPACLPHLKALRVISSHEESYKLKAHVLVSFLLCQPVLQYLHWSSGYDLSGSWADNPSYRNNEVTHKFRNQLSIASLLYHGPLPRECKLAFLSVLRPTDHHDGVAQLSEDVVSLIFGYATTPAQREICIHL